MPVTWISLLNFISWDFMTIIGIEFEFWVNVMMYNPGVCWMFVIIPFVVIVSSSILRLIWDIKTDFGRVEYWSKNKIAMPRIAIAKQSFVN